MATIDGSVCVEVVEQREGPGSTTMVVQAEDEADTLMAMSEAVGFVEGSESATLDLLLEMLDRVQKDEVLKQEAHDFARQVLEEERDAEVRVAALVAATQADDEAFERQWAARARERLGLVQASSSSSTHDAPSSSTSSTSASSSSDATNSSSGSPSSTSTSKPKASSAGRRQPESVVGAWRTRDREEAQAKQAEIKRTLQLDDEWAHWAEEDD